MFFSCLGEWPGCWFSLVLYLRVKSRGTEVPQLFHIVGFANLPEGVGLGAFLGRDEVLKLVAGFGVLAILVVSRSRRSG